jgi:tetratricopeptide (TPR) repeat protein
MLIYLKGDAPMRIRRMLWTITVALAVAGISVAAKTAASKELRLGIEAANSGYYSQAARHFENATRLEPQSLLARLNLADAYAHEYMLGPPSARSAELAQRTTEAYETVLRQAPDNKLALWDLAVFSFSAGHPQTSKRVCQKLIRIDPQNRQARYLLGVLDWATSFGSFRATLKNAGVSAPQQGPLRNASLREKLRTAQLPAINEGLQATQEAIKLDPDFGQAMIFESLLLREKAILAESPESYRRAIGQADELIAEAKASAEKSPRPRLNPRLRAEIAPPPLPAPPPPPPPPSRPASG